MDVSSSTLVRLTELGEKKQNFLCFFKSGLKTPFCSFAYEICS